MSQSQCPSCGVRFENGKTFSYEDLRGRMLYGPERLIVNAKLGASAMDTCPSCGKEFVSAPFRIFGEFVRARIRSMGGVYALVFLVAVAVVVTAMLPQGS